MGLFKPAWKSINECKAISIVEKVNDQQLLQRIAQAAPLASVRIAAGCKLNDQHFLSSMAKNERDLEVQKEIIGCITDHSVLADIALTWEGDYSIAKGAAVKQISDQTLLFEIAMNQEYCSIVRGYAVDALSQDLLATFIKKYNGRNDGWHSMWEKAFEKLTDQSLLADLAIDKNKFIRLAAVENLTNQKLLTEMELNDPDEKVRKAALLKGCELRGHNWDGCECRKCGKDRHERVGFETSIASGWTCSVCGKGDYYYTDG